MRSVIESASSYDLPILRKLLITEPGYFVESYWSKEVEIDLIVYSELDRLIRQIECKWVNNSNVIDATTISNITDKTFPYPLNYTIRKFIVCSQEVSKEINAEVSFISLKDLFSSTN